MMMSRPTQSQPHCGTTRICLVRESPTRPVQVEKTAPSLAVESSNLMFQEALAAAPVMTGLITYSISSSTSSVSRTPKKPPKSILKHSSTGGDKDDQSKADKSRSSDPQQQQTARRCVSFSGFGNSRWDEDTSKNGRRSSSSAVEHFSVGGRPSRNSQHDHHQQPHHHNSVKNAARADSSDRDVGSQKNFNWSSPPIDNGRGRTPGRKSSCCSPRLPRRVSSSASPTRTGTTTPKPPRRRRSHENLFQHKFDFFLEQTAQNGKKLEQLVKQQSETTSDSGCPPATTKHKDIEELEMSLMCMQKFMVALHSVPNNQKLLQKHMDYQTHIQHELQLVKKGQQQGDDEEDDDDCYSGGEEDEDDDDEDALNELYQEMIRQGPLAALSIIGEDMSEAVDDNEEEEDDEC